MKESNRLFLFKAYNFVLLVLAVLAVSAFYQYSSITSFPEFRTFVREFVRTPDLSGIAPWMWLPVIVGFVGMLVGAIFNPFRKSTAYGSARWAKLKDVVKMGLSASEGLILAVFKSIYIRFNKDLSALLIAPPGTGKTASIVIPALMSLKRSMVVHDVKDELWAITSKRRSAMGKVIRFAPVSDETQCFNPFDKSLLREVLEENIGIVDQVGAMLIKEGGNEEKEDHWISSARDLFKTIALYNIWKNGDTSIPAIRDVLLSDSNFQEVLFDWLDDDDAAPEGEQMPAELRRLVNDSAGAAEEEFTGVRRTLSSKLNIFADPRIRRSFEKSDFKVSDIREGITTVYLHVPVTDIKRLAPLISMFLELLGNHILSNPQGGKERVLFLLDEFAWLGKIPSMIKLPSLSRGEGGSVLFVCQSYSQIEDIYGKSAVNTLKGTCAYRIILPQNEEETAESIAKAIGDETRKRVSKSTQTGDKSGGSESTSGEGFKLITAQKLLSMKEEDCIILAQNHFMTPIFAKQCRWYKDKNMKNLGGSIDFKAI